MQTDVNDTPIKQPDQDEFGITPFAAGIAQGISKMKAPAGYTIAINGPWGAGKSSAINLIRHYLKTEHADNGFEVIDFRCWWFRGEEALTLAFLQELNAALVKSIGGKETHLIPEIGKLLLQARPVVGPAINMATGSPLGTLFSGAMKFSERFFQSESLESLFQRLEKVLEVQGKRFLFIIDDIDRLTPDEALIVFTLIKSVGRLPNVVYLVAFDRKVSEKAIADRFPSEGPAYLEKIIQSSFELPLPSPTDLNDAMYSAIQNICGPFELNEERYFMNMFYDGIAPFLTIPRDIVRISNALMVSFPPIMFEVEIASFVSMEILRLYEPDLYGAIRGNKAHVCGVNGHGEDSRAMLDKLLECVEPEKHSMIERLLTRLFPRLENMGYSGDFLRQWDAMRLVCVEKHFDTYFRMSLSDDAMPAPEITMFVSKCGDEEFVKAHLLEAADTIRKTGRTRVPLILDTISANAERVDDENVPNFVKALFEIADDIDREEDRGRGFNSFGNNHREILWLIQDLVVRRYPIKDRTEIFYRACENAQIGWLSYFVSWAVEDHFPREGKTPELEKKCFVHKDDLDRFKQLALGKFKEAARDGSLIQHPKLPGILFRWSEFSGEGDDSLRQWTDEQLNNNYSLVMLTKAFTSEVWSHTSGDNVSVKRLQASINGIDKILDKERFRKRLQEYLSNSVLGKEERESIETFLSSWQKQDSGDEFRQ